MLRVQLERISFFCDMYSFPRDREKIYNNFMTLQLHAHLFPSEMRILILKNYAMLQSRGPEMIADIVTRTRNCTKR